MTRKVLTSKEDTAGSNESASITLDISHGEEKSMRKIVSDDKRDELDGTT